MSSDRQDTCNSRIPGKEGNNCVQEHLFFRKLRVKLTHKQWIRPSCLGYRPGGGGNKALARLLLEGIYHRGPT